MAEETETGQTYTETSEGNEAEETGTTEETGTEGNEAEGEGNEGGEGESGEGEGEESSESELTINVPEGIEVDTRLSEAGLEIAKKYSIPQEAMDELTQLVIADRENLATDGDKAFTDMLGAWDKEARSDKEFGGDNFDENVAIAAKAVEKFGGEPLKELFETSGLGNHPEMIRAFWKMGQLIAEDGTVPVGSPTRDDDGSEAARARRMYPNDAKSG